MGFVVDWRDIAGEWKQIVYIIIIVQVHGAMPYNLTSLDSIRNMLRELGGEEAAKVMPPPTFSLCVNKQGRMFVRITPGEVSGLVMGIASNRIMLPYVSFHRYFTSVLASLPKIHLLEYGTRTFRRQRAVRTSIRDSIRREGDYR